MWSTFRPPKTRRDGSPPELVRMHTLRVDVEAKAELKLDELLSSAMNQVGGYTPVAPDESPSDRPNGDAIPHEADERPRPVQRRTSSALALYGTPPPRRSNSETTSPYSPAELPLDDVAADGTSPTMWSSAVGRATTGKSGRVIERIQAENDRLRRELKLEILRREEEQKKSDMARGQIESLEATKDNLVLIQDQSRASLARKERKVEDLKADLDAERARRRDAESQLQQVTCDHERTENELKARLREETERAKRAVGQYEALSSSWRQMDDDYRRKTERLRTDMARLQADAVDGRRKLERLESTVAQQRQELDKMRVARDGVIREFEHFKRESDAGTKSIRERARLNEQAHDAALAEMLGVMGEMRHVINVKRFVRDAE